MADALAMSSHLGAEPAAVVGPADLDAHIDEASSIGRWQTFLSAYSRGEFPAEHYPPLPPTSPRTAISNPFEASPPSGPRRTAELPAADELYPSATIDASTARNVWDYISAHHYMPPPRAADEVLREQCVVEYELDGAAQRRNIQAAVDILAAYFPGTVCTFTIFNGAKQSFIAVAGDQGIRDGFGLVHDFVVRSDLGLCGHCVLVKREPIMFVPSLPDDWRFDGNPYTQAGIKSYIGAPVTLPIDRLATSARSTAGSWRDDVSEQRVGIGALNILFVKEPLERMTDEHTMVVGNVARMMETQLRSTWDGNRRTMEARYRRAVAEMIEDAFVGKDVSFLGDAHEERGSTPTMGFEALAQSAADRLMELVSHLDSVMILDTRDAMHRMPSKELVADPNTQTLPILARSGVSFSAPPPSSVATLANRRSSRCVFDSSYTSGLESTLPSEATAHFVMPFSTTDRPAFTLIATSTRVSSFTSSAINVIRSIGALLLARATQDAVVEADAAKTIFLSSISHELRTPLYSIMTALRLAVEHVQEGELAAVEELLEAMRSSSVALQGTLDDVLDFGRPQTKQVTSPSRDIAAVTAGGDNPVDTDPDMLAEEVRAGRPAVNLVQIAREVTRMCLMQLQAPPKRGIVLDYDEDKDDWTVRMDEAKFRRIVTNGLSNALKFCPEGDITVRLSSSPPVPSGSERGTDTAGSGSHFELSVTDNGPGIEPSLIPSLLQPFTKKDVHTPGIGLGLHITKTLVQSLGGVLDISSPGERGTTFTVTLPRIPSLETVKDDNKRRRGGNREVVSVSAMRGPLSPRRQLTRSPTYRGQTTTGPHTTTAGVRAGPLDTPSPPGLSTSPESTPLSDGPPQTPPIDLPAPAEPMIASTGVDAAIELGMADLEIHPPSAAGEIGVEDVIGQTGDKRHIVSPDHSVRPSIPAAQTEAIRVMVIDDNDICRRLLAALVIKMAKKHRKKAQTSRVPPVSELAPIVREFADGPSAVDAFLEMRPHLVLTDVSMPGMDGVTAAQHMRALGTTLDDSGDGVNQGWTAGQCAIYAITGLGSSDPRLKASGMLGSAALNGWLVKGKDDMRRVEEIIGETMARMVI